MIESKPRAEVETAILAEWIKAIQIVGIPKSQIPTTAEDRTKMIEMLDRFFTKYRRYKLISVLNAIERFANDKAIEYAESNIYPTFSIGHIVLAVEKYASPEPETEKLLTGRSQSEREREEIEKSWQGDPLEVAKEKAPKLLNQIDMGLTYLLINLKLHYKDVIKAMREFLSEPDQAQVIETAKNEWRLNVIARFPQAQRFITQQPEIKPDELLYELERTILREGMSGGYVRDQFPDYDLTYIAALIRMFNSKIQGNNQNAH